MAKDRKRIRQGEPDPKSITVEQVVAWADEFHQHHGQGPDTGRSQNRSKITVEQTMAWAEEWHEEHGRWPGEDDGEKNADAEPE